MAVSVKETPDPVPKYDMQDVQHAPILKALEDRTKAAVKGLPELTGLDDIWRCDGGSSQCWMRLPC